MKTLFYCLLMLSHAWSGKPVVSHSAPGGVSVLAVNTEESTIDWKAQKPTGTHMGKVKIGSGTLIMHCGQLYSGTISMDMNTMAVIDLSGHDKNVLETNLRSSYFFDAGKFPEARLDIINVDHRSEKAFHFVTVLANLTLHGITKQITFTADVSKSTVNDFAAQANITINRRDFAVATSNFKYDTFIYKDIQLHVSLQASRPEPSISSL